MPMLSTPPILNQPARGGPAPTADPASAGDAAAQPFAQALDAATEHQAGAGDEVGGHRAREAAGRGDHRHPGAATSARAGREALAAKASMQEPAGAGLPKGPSVDPLLADRSTEPPTATDDAAAQDGDPQGLLDLTAWLPGLAQAAAAAPEVAPAQGEPEHRRGAKAQRLEASRGDAATAVRSADDDALRPGGVAAGEGTAGSRGLPPALPVGDARRSPSPAASTSAATMAAPAATARDTAAAVGAGAQTAAPRQPVVVEKSNAEAGAGVAWATLLPLTAPPATHPAKPFQAEVFAPLGSPQFAPALGSQLSVLVRDGIEHAQLKLNPADMGPIEVRISLDGSQAQVDFSAAHAGTRQILQDAVPALASALRESGLTLTGGGVFDQAREQRGDAPRDPSPQRMPGFEEARDSSLPLASAARPDRARGVVDLYA